MSLYRNIEKSSHNSLNKKMSELSPWYAIKFNALRHKIVCQWLEKQGLEYFVPMHYVNVELENRVKHVLRPVVSNIIFVKKSMEESQFRNLLGESAYNMTVYTKNRQSKEYYEIPGHEMHEFMIMCNPEIELRKYLTEEKAKMKKGDRVFVKYGPLKGLTGKLVRYNRKYYLLKEVPGMGVMLKVARWCCVPAIES